jgi:hypothetical protein
MHDGENLFNDSTSFGGRSWRAQWTVELLVNEGTIEEVVIVGVYNTMARMDEYTPVYDKTGCLLLFASIFFIKVTFRKMRW